MIDIQDKSQCCGCWACAQRCPQSCITMQEDEKGFLYPRVNVDVCVHCGLCEQVCPFSNVGEEQEPNNCFAATNSDDTVRLASSSGGVFTLLANRVVQDGGVVFGARYDEQWMVVHDCADTLDGVVAFRGSKYVQSVIGDSYQRIEQFLNQGKTVLFSGTPCQISGLKSFLRKDSPNLITIEVACHGVPSPKVWRQYLGSQAKGEPIAQVNFRDKSTGWHDYSVLIGKKKKRHDNDDYMACYLANYNCRESCFTCPFKKGKSGADILIADFWGVEGAPGVKNDDKGINAVIVYSNKGLSLLERSSVYLTNVDAKMIVKHNDCINGCPSKPRDYDAFWKSYGKHSAWTLKRYGTLSFRKLMVRAKKIISHLVR